MAGDGREDYSGLGLNVDASDNPLCREEISNINKTLSDLFEMLSNLTNNIPE